MKSNRNRWFWPWIAGILGITCSAVVAAPAAGPLRVHPDNSRYFTDGTKTQNDTLRAVYLTGAHTWNNLVDMGRIGSTGGVRL